MIIAWDGTVDKLIFLITYFVYIQKGMGVTDALNIAPSAKRKYRTI